MIYKKYDDNTYGEFGMVVRADRRYEGYKVVQVEDEYWHEMLFKTEQLAQNWIDWYIGLYRKVTGLNN